MNRISCLFYDRLADIFKNPNKNTENVNNKLNNCCINPVLKI